MEKKDLLYMEEDKSGRGQISSSLCGKCNKREGAVVLRGVWVDAKARHARQVSGGNANSYLILCLLNPTNHFAGFGNISGNGHSIGNGNDSGYGNNSQ